jgi:hypothetical protein
MTNLTPEAVKAALDGATKGKRVQFHPDYCNEAKGSDWKEWDTSHDTSVILQNGTRYKGYPHHKHAADATLDNMAPDLARDWLHLKEVEKAGKKLARQLFEAVDELQECSMELTGENCNSPVYNPAHNEALTAFRAALKGDKT